MSQKKEGKEENKPGVKIQDLSPKKDAKGGGGRFNQENKIGGAENRAANNPTGGAANSSAGRGLD